MTAPILRTPELCPHRRPLAAEVDTGTYFCGLAAEAVGAADHSLCTVRNSACQLCCQQRVPRAEAPNPVVATAIFKAAYRIAKSGGVDGCDVDKAAGLKTYAVRFLPLLESADSLKGAGRITNEYTGPCRHLGPQTGEEDCKTCVGKVRRKVFGCRHPLHTRTTIVDCRQCVDYQSGENRRAVENWVIGMTTAPRTESTLKRSLESLRNAGWTGLIHLFAEQDPGVPVTDLPDVHVIQRSGPALGAWSNFILSLNELYHRDPRADAYLMVQDDVIYCRGLKEYLEQALWPGASPGIVSLHTPRHLAAPRGTGFYTADVGWGAWGAQALIFSNAAVRAFLSDAQVTDHRLKGVLEGKKNVDSVVGDWCRRSKYEFWLHAPSLCEHIGATSTLWPQGELKGRRVSADFPGATKSLSKLLKARRKKMGDGPAPALRMLPHGKVEYLDAPAPAEHRNLSAGGGGTAHPKAGVAEQAPVATVAPTGMLGLVIVTHAGYVHHLAKVLESVEQQRAILDEVILAVDGDMPLPELPPWVRLVQGQWNSPQLARNAGLAATRCQWICYLDGDNLPSIGFFQTMCAKVKAAAATTGIIYPGTVLRVTEDTEAQRVFVMPEWDRLQAREKSIVDTSSAWRVAALRTAGGWFMPCDILDDYTTVLQLIHHGWQGERAADAVAVLRHHADRRSRAVETIPGTLWHARRHLLLTLFAGRYEPLPRILDWYRNAEMPPQTAIHWVDNSGDAKFHARLWRAAESLGAEKGFSSITITRDHTRPPDTSFESIHNHVAALYNRALDSVSADVVITIEDDVIPPPDALRRLVGPLQPWATVAAVAAVYPSRDNPGVATVSLETSQWQRMPRIEALPPASVMPVGMVAGGCTAWHAPTLLRMLPLQAAPRLGWDGNLSARLNLAGYRLLLATDIRCDHLAGPERLPAKTTRPRSKSREPARRFPTA